MNNSDNFEKIAADAVGILMGLIQAMAESGKDDPAAAILALILADAAEDLCVRAIALGAE